MMALYIKSERLRKLDSRIYERVDLAAVLMKYATSTLHY
jgi:hypothetical protein